MDQEVRYRLLLWFGAKGRDHQHAGREHRAAGYLRRADAVAVPDRITAGSGWLRLLRSTVDQDGEQHGVALGGC